MIRPGSIKILFTSRMLETVSRRLARKRQKRKPERTVRANWQARQTLSALALLG